MRNKPLLDNDVVSWVVKEVLVGGTCKNIKELKGTLQAIA